MSHEDDEAVIILSVVITPELAACLDRKVAAGPFGASREEVAQLYLCNSFGVSVPFKLPDQAARIAPGGGDE